MACYYSFSGSSLQWNVGELVVDVVGFVSSLVLLGTYSGIALSKRYNRKVAPWWLFVPAIVFSLV